MAPTWLRGRPGIAAPIASARTLDQLPALIAAATLDLTAAEVEALDEVSARVPQWSADETGVVGGGHVLVAVTADQAACPPVPGGLISGRCRAPGAPAPVPWCRIRGPGG